MNPGGSGYLGVVPHHKPQTDVTEGNLLVCIGFSLYAGLYFDIKNRF